MTHPLRARLDELRGRDAALATFGARAHRFQATPAPAAAIAAFEARHGARLPAAFVELLREVTDGGAGPGYGLVPLERPARADVAEDLARLGEPFAAGEFLTLEPPDVDPDDEDAHAAAMDHYWREMPGTMTLVHYGCGIRAQLVVTGPLAGQVLLDQRADTAGVRRFTRAVDGRWNCWERPAVDDRTPLDVLAWYGDWLDASLARLG